MGDLGVPAPGAGDNCTSGASSGKHAEDAARSRAARAQALGSQRTSLEGGLEEKQEEPVAPMQWWQWPLQALVRALAACGNYSHSAPHARRLCRTDPARHGVAVCVDIRHVPSVLAQRVHAHKDLHRPGGVVRGATVTSQAAALASQPCRCRRRQSAPARPPACPQATTRHRTHVGGRPGVLPGACGLPRRPAPASPRHSLPSLAAVVHLPRHVAGRRGDPASCAVPPAPHVRVGGPHPPRAAGHDEVRVAAAQPVPPDGPGRSHCSGRAARRGARAEAGHPGAHSGLA